MTDRTHDERAAAKLAHVTDAKLAGLVILHNHPAPGLVTTINPKTSVETIYTAEEWSA